MILYRYFLKEITLTALAVSGILTVIAMSWRFRGYLEDAASGSLNSEILFILIIWRLPSFLEIVVPVSFFLSVILVLGRLSAENEMIAMKSFGLSPGNIGLMILSLALFFSVISGLLAGFIKPLGERQVDQLLIAQANQTDFDELIPGRFQSFRFGERVIYARKVSNQNQLEDIFINAFHEESKVTAPRHFSTILARTGYFDFSATNELMLVLQDGTRFYGRPGMADYEVISFQEYGQPIRTGSRLSSNNSFSSMTNSQLFNSMDPEAIAELHWRLAMILLIPILGFIAIPFSEVSAREGRYGKVVPAMIICFLYIFSLAAGKSAIAREEIPSFIGLWWAHAIFIFIAVFSFHKDRIFLLSVLKFVFPKQNHSSS
ncbi:MAG: LPS export ABC transporter permease LptF [Gammaproteobacteria bacterium]|nr:LPS export ABC transporter permease LptF [Gammaproteobacteria bacterium]